MIFKNFSSDLHKHATIFIVFNKIKVSLNYWQFYELEIKHSKMTKRDLDRPYIYGRRVGLIQKYHLIKPRLIAEIVLKSIIIVIKIICFVVNSSIIKEQDRGNILI